MTKITQLLSSNDAMDALAAAIEALPGGVQALEDSVASQLAQVEPVIEIPAAETP